MTTLWILILEADLGDAMLIQDQLGRTGFALERRVVSTGREYGAALASAYWDLVIADDVPGLGVASALDVLRRSGQDAPFVVVSSAIDDGLAGELLRAGASEVVDKNRLSRLMPAVVRELQNAGTRRAKRGGGAALHLGDVGEAALGRKILLVEDDTAVRDIVRRTLTRAGFRVTEAPSPSEALRMITSESRPPAVDLLITDLSMPEMSGFELAERVTSVLGDLPILYMSGSPPEVIPHRVREIPKGQFLSKPFTIDELTARVRDALAGK